MPHELTTSFVEDIVGRPLKSVEISDGCQAGDGIASSLSSIKAVTQGNEEIYLVFKTVPPKEEQRFDPIEFGCFKNEGTVYKELGPCLEQLIKERGGNYKFPLPKLYKLFLDNKSDYICMEDVRPAGYKMAKVFDGLPYAETSLVLRELGAFHAFSYFLIRHLGEKIFEDGGRFETFNPKAMRAPEKMAEFDFMMESAVKTAVKILETTGNPELGKKIREKVPEGKAGSMFQNTAKATDTIMFPCLVHGDCWSNNFLIKHEQIGDEKRPVSVRFVDFQFTRRGNIFEDLVYLIFTSTNTAFRSKHLLNVLHDYFDSFEKSLASIKFPMPLNFTRGFLIDAFHSHSLGALVHMTFAIPLQMGDPEQLNAPSPPLIGAKDENKTEEPSNGIKGEHHNFSSPDPEDPIGLFLLMKSSPRAIQRLTEITQEILC